MLTSAFATFDSSATESIPAINLRNIKYWEIGRCDVSAELMNWMSLPKPSTWNSINRV